MPARTLLAKFLELETRERARVPLIVAALLWYRFVNGRLSTMANPPREVQPGDTDDAVRTGLLVEQIATHTPWHCSCLVRAWAASYLLRRYSPRLHIGSRLKSGADEAELEAHAWISVNGVIVCGGSVAADYEEFSRFDSRKLAAMDGDSFTA